jgi:uncharacterized protein
MAAGKFEIIKEKAGKYRWHLKAANDEIVAVSQAYKTLAGAQKGIEAVLRAAAADGVDVTEETAKK